MGKNRILVLDDEEGMLEVYRDTLQRIPDLDIVTESNSEKGAELVKAESFDLIITDLKCPKLA